MISIICLLLGIEKGIEKAKEGIRSKRISRGRQQVRIRAPCGRTVPSCDLTCPWERFGMHSANNRTTARSHRGYKVKAAFLLIVRPHGTYYTSTQDQAPLLLAIQVISYFALVTNSHHCNLDIFTTKSEHQFSIPRENDLSSILGIFNWLQALDSEPTLGASSGGKCQVLLGRPFLKRASFQLDYIDGTFSFRVRNVTEIFHPARPTELRKKSAQQIQVCNDDVRGDNDLMEAENRKSGNPKDKIERVKSVKKKRKHEEGSLKKKFEEDKTRKKIELKCANVDDLIRKLKASKGALYNNKSLDTHLVQDHSKCK
ncbi:hypothetical protein PIB30_076578 [Stylosanthes scabra]|uniref:Uncharacterized protein n=1 Tax=Stylosanthes scabra TaxID=79078 RepID=A0ABU6VNQ3_9FABA|nr:hypothetical protein [Stylosanthes scabra]